MMRIKALSLKNSSKECKKYKRSENRRQIRCIRLSAGFSMLELVFVIVILGLLAAIAIPKFSVTRIDAQVVAIESDINNTISTVVREIFSQNLDPLTLTINDIYNIAGLSPSRWVVQGDSIVLANNGVVDQKNNCVSLKINQTTSTLDFTITQRNDSTLCKKLLTRHPTGLKQTPLSTSNAIF